MAEIDIRISELTERVSPRTTDELPINDMSLATPVTKRTTVAALLALIAPDRYAPQVGLWLPGDDASYVATPHHADLAASDELDLLIELQPASWRPAAQSALITKWEVAGELAYRLSLTPTGELRLGLSTDGTAEVTATSTAAVPNDDARRYARATYRETDERVQFWTSSTTETWTKLGDDVTATGAGLIHAGMSELALGAAEAGATERLQGTIYGAAVRTGIDGPDVASPALSVPVSPRHRDAAGRTWEFVGTAWAWSG